MKKRDVNFLIGLPSIVWLILFYVLPVVIVFFLAFKPVDPYGGIGAGWTLETIRNLSNPSYPAIIWRTVWLGFVSTFISVLIAIPIAYQLSCMSIRMRNITLMLIVVPFWTNFLIRIYAWKVFLHPEGIVTRTLAVLGFVPQGAVLLYNEYAVLAVMVYTYLPFAILPIYAAADKFDFSLLDAAKDLGASSFQAFVKIFLPAISKGIWTAVAVVLIPAFGAYLIPHFVGGPASEMIGDKIVESALAQRNLPRASALSAVLMAAVFVPLMLFIWLRRMKDGRRGRRKEMAR